MKQESLKTLIKKLNFQQRHIENVSYTFQEVLQLVEAVREKQHEATKEAVYALYCDCSGEINEEDLNILEMPEIE